MYLIDDIIYIEELYTFHWYSGICMLEIVVFFLHQYDVMTHRTTTPIYSFQISNDGDMVGNYRHIMGLLWEV